MHILLINVHSTKNEGDSVLLKKSLSLLTAVFPDAKITLAVNEPNIKAMDNSTLPSIMWWFKRTTKTQKSEWIFTHILFLPFLLTFAGLALRLSRKYPSKLLDLFPKPYANLLQTYLNADLVLSAPGNYLYTSGNSGLVFFLILTSCFFALLANKPLYFLPQTVGPIHRKWEQVLLGEILIRSRLIFLRDTFSITSIKKCIKKPVSAVVCRDLALYSNIFPASLGHSLLEKHLSSINHLKKPFLGVTVINWEKLNPSFEKQPIYEQAIADAIDFFIAKYQGSVFLFSQVQGPSYAEDDRIPTQRVYRLVKNQSNVIFISNYTSTDQLISAYGLMDIFIGTRLHSNIFAITQHVPVLPIAYQPKTYGVMQTLGLQSWVISIDKINSEILIKKLSLLWSEHQQVAVQISHSLSRIQKEIDWVGLLIKQDFAQFKTQYAVA